MTLAQVRIDSRTRLHRALSRPFLCYADGPDGAALEVSARLHVKSGIVGSLPGAGSGLAQFRDVSPELVFLSSEHSPQKSNVYVLYEDETRDPDNIYVVDSVDPPDGITITAACAWANQDRRSEYVPVVP